MKQIFRLQLNYAQSTYALLKDIFGFYNLIIGYINYGFRWASISFSIKNLKNNITIINDLDEI